MIRRFFLWLVWLTFGRKLKEAIRFACRKVRIDPQSAERSPEALRAEACEWTRLYLKDWHKAAKPAAIFLGCEVFYQMRLKGR